MKMQLVRALGRQLDRKEESVINWLCGWDKSTKEAFEILFRDMYRAGQADAIAAIKEQEQTIAFFQCEDAGCSELYAIDPQVTEEPRCPYCGSEYFTHVADKQVSLKCESKAI